jgi:hypothetical protein
VVGGETAAFTAFVVAALTIVLVMFGLVFAVGTSQEGVIRGLKANTHRIRRWSGVILVLVGTWLIILAIWADAFARILPV